MPNTTPYSCSYSRVVELYTNCGVISVELYDDESHCVAESFYRLAASGQLDGVVVSRLIPSFVIEFSVAGHPVFGEWMDVDVCNSLHHTGAGIVSCPRRGLEAGSFFITLGPQPFLDEACIIFGRVYSGMRVVQNISQLSVSAETFHLFSPVVIERCNVRLLPRAERPTSLLPQRLNNGASKPLNRRRTKSVLDSLE
ncbi:putative Cyclophilin type peptidyl prolyl cis trans isomerase [Trypanosoma vivax]|uniref:Peptidyl-prolyl cis-trans isomerase n=1 Tax=Trypanosoma vivax (strain Y486) TaxID=1055687 RepID=G0U0F1_TRYVY|nr:putative cyclophilin type peptidyl-prolyl cis-trans isomerase [Trypanosoma vivax]KAH8610888.1 putative Cyclophilin type peptidyl prolyl cis trans isomerase [Trypanosoma vivax]CCC49549.1 putative cyclophilin type peptidyl-prolyl cis-trans isomerase [Trypanosoma vivax Y486]